MVRAHLVRVDGKTFHVLKELKASSGVPIGTQIRHHVLGKPCKIKKLGEY